MNGLKRSISPRNESGFSLIDVVISVAIVISLSVGGFVSYMGVVDNGKLSAVKTAAAQVFTAAVVAENDKDAATNNGSVKADFEGRNSKIRIDIAGSAETLTVTATDRDDPSISAVHKDATGSGGGTTVPVDPTPVPTPTPTTPPVVVPTPTPTPTTTPVVPTPTPTPTPTVPPVGPITVARTNLMMNPMGSSATDLDGFGRANGATTVFDTATKGLRLATPISSTRDSGLGIHGLISYTPGVATYTVSMDVTGVKTESWRFSVQGAWRSPTSASSPVRVAAGETKRISHTFTSTDGAKSALYLLRDSGAVAGEVIIKNIVFEKSDTALPFFDGSAPSQMTGGITYSHSWTGIPNESTSIATYRPNGG